MKQKFKYVLALVFVSQIFASTMAQTPKESLHKYFSALNKHGDFNGNVLVAEKGKIIYEASYGYADFSKKILNNKTTAFPVASITKTITATAILQLQEKGKLSINDPYNKYFPDFPYTTVTIKQLLSHISRLPSPAFYQFLDSLRKNNTDTFFVNSDVIPALNKMNKPLLGKSAEGDRSAFAYSNLNYYLLAILIEKLSGMPYAAYLKKNIFMPAGMEHTSLSEFYFGLDKNLCREHRFKYLYSQSPELIDTIPDFQYIFSTYNLKGHGDVVSTIHDLLKYDQALYNGILLKQSSLDQAFKLIVPEENDNSGYGLGWSIREQNSNGKIVLHHGGGLGIEIMLVRNIDKKQTVILFDNMKNPPFYTALNALKLLNGEKVPIPKKSVAKAYASTLMKDGIEKARILLDKIRKDTLNYSLSEYQMNLLAYQLMGDEQDALAYEIFKSNVELFPDSWNVYDSYGEILLKMGRKQEAIEMYQKSMSLNPNNENGKMMLEQIQKSK